MRKRGKLSVFWYVVGAVMLVVAGLTTAGPFGTLLCAVAGGMIGHAAAEAEL